MGADSPVVGPNTAAELRAFLASPRSDSDMPTPERIDKMIARLAMATKERALSVAEAKERMELYWRALRDVPLVDLAAAFDQLLKTSKFMPTPSEVYSTARSSKARREYLFSRARYLVGLHEREWSPPLRDEDRAGPEDIAAIREKFATQCAASSADAAG